MKKLFIPLIAFLLLLGAGCMIKGNQTDGMTIAPDPVMCTEEARECPDGSYVGRTGPNCEFAPCPQTLTPPPNPKINQPDNKSHKTITIGGVISIQIPQNCNVQKENNSTYIYCTNQINGIPENNDLPEIVFYADKTKVDINLWEGMASPYWDSIISSLKVLTPLSHGLQINIGR